MKKLLFAIIFILFTILLAFYIKGDKGNPIYYQKELNTQVAGPFEASNSTARYALTSAIVHDHTFFLSQDLAKFSSPDVVYYNGKFISIFTPGVSFIGVPFFIIGDSFGLPQLSTYLLTTIIALINVFLIALIVKKLTGSLSAGFISGFTFLFATNALAYSLTFTQHHMSILLILLGILNSMQKRTWINNTIFGALFGFGLMVDIPNLFLMLPILIYIISKHFIIKNQPQRVALSIKASLVGLLIGLLPLVGMFAGYNYATTKSPTMLAQSIQRAEIEGSKLLAQQHVTTTTTPNSPVGLTNFVFQTRRQLDGIYVLFISNERAWWYYSPLVFFGFIGIYSLFKKKENSTIATVITGIILIDILLYSMFGDPWGGWAFGPRYLLPAAAMLSICIGVALANYKKSTILLGIFIILLTYSVWVSSLGALTTASIPPKGEAEHLATFIPYTYAYNTQFLFQDKSSSLFYNEIFAKKLSLQYFYIIVSTLSTILFIPLLWFLYDKKEDTK